MKKTKTDELETALSNTGDFSSFFKENEEQFIPSTVSTHLQELVDSRNIRKSALARASGVNEVYMHQIFSGRRKPSRKTFLCLCIGANASLDEVQELLLRCGYATLYSRNHWDAILIYGISHSLSVQEINGLLQEEGAELLT